MYCFNTNHPVLKVLKLTPARVHLWGYTNDRLSNDASQRTLARPRRLWAPSVATSRRWRSPGTRPRALRMLPVEVRCYIWWLDVSHETPDVTPCRTSPPMLFFRTRLARNAWCNTMSHLTAAGGATTRKSQVNHETQTWLANSAAHHGHELLTPRATLSMTAGVNHGTTHVTTCKHLYTNCDTPPYITMW